MKERILRECQKLRQTYRAGGLTGGLHQLARAVLAALYHRDAQYIFVRRVEASNALPAVEQTGEEPNLRCLIVESGEALQAVAREIPTSIRDSADQMKKRG